MIKVNKFGMKVQKTFEESLVFNLPSEFQLAYTKFPDVTKKTILLYYNLLFPVIIVLKLWYNVKDLSH